MSDSVSSLPVNDDPTTSRARGSAQDGHTRVVNYEAGETYLASLATRLIAGLIAASALVVLLVAASLDAMPNRYGTHAQLGFPPCRWVTHLGLPCPTCGMTTAFTNLVHLRVGEGFLSQPFGFILAIGTAVAFWLSLFVSLTGSRVYRCATAFWKPAFLWSLAALAFLAWVFKIWWMTSFGDIA